MGGVPPASVSRIERKTKCPTMESRIVDPSDTAIRLERMLASKRRRTAEWYARNRESILARRRQLYFAMRKLAGAESGTAKHNGGAGRHLNYLQSLGSRLPRAGGRSRELDSARTSPSWPRSTGATMWSIPEAAAPSTLCCGSGVSTPLTGQAK